MPVIWEALLAALGEPTLAGAASELALLCAPFVAAVLAGLLVGWSWRPFSGVEPEGDVGGPRAEEGGGPASASVSTDDLEWLRKLVDEKDGGPAWVHIMDRALPAVSYRAWRRDTKYGPGEYRSRTVFEDVTPEIVRDFFWDDGFRIKLKWDDMLISHNTLEQCPITGTMIVQWIRKLPFFCSNREYIIGRRIWELDGSYYCVTKGVNHPSLPRRNKPRRVDLYYSSWCIRAVESRLGNGKMTACEVLLFHHEDAGIPREIARLGIRWGMWGMVKKIEPGLRAYQLAREEGANSSPCAHIAQASATSGSVFVQRPEPENDPLAVGEVHKDKQALSVSKFLIIGGAVALACTLDRGLFTKAMIFGVGRRFARQVK